MCQIIHKIRDYNLPLDLLRNTCITNPDGFGIMMFDQGKLVSERIYTGEDNNPEEIAGFLESIYSKEAFIHFRYKTKGNVSKESCHPFKIYNDNDREVYLMHNGTLSDYGSNTKVDSEDFGEQIVAPLYETFLKSGTRNPLRNDFFTQILNKFVGTGSKIVLMDNVGDYSIINQKAGELYEDKSQEKKFWVSNTYSFNRYHRGTTTTTTYYGYRGGTYGKGGSSQNNLPFDASSSTASSTVNPGGQSVVPTTKTFSPAKVVVPSIPRRKVVKSYWRDILELDSIDDILDMTNEDIGELVDLEPENAKLLIKDLIYELYSLVYTVNEDPSEGTEND